MSIGVCLFTARQCLDNNLIRIGMFIVLDTFVNTYFYRVKTVVRRTCDGFHFVKNEKMKALGKNGVQNTSVLYPNSCKNEACYNEVQVYVVCCRLPDGCVRLPEWTELLEWTLICGFGYW